MQSLKQAALFCTLGLLLSGQVSAADGAIAYCGNIKQKTSGSSVATRLVPSGYEGNGRVDIFYCDAKGQCKIALQFPSSDFKSMEWRSNLQLLISTGSLSSEGLMMAVNFSPRGANYSAPLSIVNASSFEAGEASEKLSFNKDLCEVREGPIVSS